MQVTRTYICITYLFNEIEVVDWMVVGDEDRVAGNLRWPYTTTAKAVSR